MVSKYGIKKISFVLVLGFIINFISLKHSEPNNPEKEVKAKNYSHLKDGDLVCRLGRGFFSNLFREYASKEKVYSHIGIVIIENNSYYVIHSEASEFTGIGGVKKEKLIDFLNKVSVFSFFRIDVDQSKKIEIIRKSKFYLENNIKFDLNFDSSDDSKMYCTEFIAKCINHGMEEEIIKPTLRLKNSIFYTLDDIYNNKLVHKL